MLDTQHIPLKTPDGFELCGHLYTGPEPRQAILVASALAVPQVYYGKFCSWLASHGYAVLTYDPRGMSASRPEEFSRSLRGFHADFDIWARQDFSTAVLLLRDRYPDLPIKVIGHSLGAQHPGMATEDAQAAIKGLLAICSGAGYWRDWAWRSRLAAPLLFHSIGPLLNRQLGYFPGRRLGMVGDLPQGVMSQWIRWCRHPGFSWGADPETVGALYKRVAFPIHALSFSDDEAMTAHCTRKLLAAYANASSSMEIIDPASLGLDRVGHTGFFRDKFSTSLWPKVLSWLE